MENLDEYLNQDIFNPKYLFHGSSKLLEKLEPRQSKDKYNAENEDCAIFLSSWFINAAAYAFRSKLKEINEYYSFRMNNNGILPAMEYEVENIPENLFGYIYVLKKEEDITKDSYEYTTQYRCYHELEPIKVIKVNFDYFEKYFQRVEQKQRKK